LPGVTVGPASRARALVRRGRDAAVAEQFVEPLGGRANAFEVGEPRPGARLGSALAQRLAGGPDALEGWAKRVARRREVRGLRGALRQHLVQQREELAGVGAE
jgi:hypothetical protein